MLSDPADRAAYINSLLGRAYRLGATGPEEFDCYGLARHLQEVFWGRAMPIFEAPSGVGRFALAAAISTHPERVNWVESRPVDGALVTMAKQEIGYHIGVYLALDGGLVAHTLEDSGVTTDKVFALESIGWRRLRFLSHI